MEYLKLGEVYTPARYRQQGAYLLINGSGIIIWLNYNSPTKAEISNWTKPNKTWFDYVVVDDTFLLLARADGEKWVDIPYNPQASSEYTELKTPGENEGYLVIIMMTNQLDGKIVGLRLVSFNHELSVNIKNELDTLLIKEPDLTIQKHMQRLNLIYMKYPTTQDLVKLGKCRYVIK